MSRRKTNNGQPYLSSHLGKPAVYWWNEDGIKKRATSFADQAEAEEFLRQKQEEINRSIAFSGTGLEPRPTSLLPEKLRDAETGFSMLEKNGFGETSFVDVVAFFLDNYKDPELTPCMTDFIDEFITRKESAKRAAKTISQFKTNLNDFAKFCQQKGKPRLHQITTELIEEYLDGLKVRPLTGSRAEKVEASAQTKSNRLQNIHTLLNSAVKRRHILINPAIAIDDYDVTRKPKAFFSIPEIKKLLKRSKEEGLFAHYYFRLATMFREREMVRFTELNDYWQHIDLKAGQILLPASCCKTQRDKRNGGRRINLNTQPNLKAFLRIFKKQNMTLAKDSQKERKLFAELKENPEDRHNIIRDTAISLHARYVNSVFDTAQEAGNSEEMINSHYLVIYSRKDAGQFFKLKPSDFGV